MKSIVFDTNMFDELALGSHHKSPFDMKASAMACFIDHIDQTKQRIVVPTPVMAEILSAQGSSAKNYYLDLEKESAFILAPLDEVAAAEAASITRQIRLSNITQGRERNGRQEVKVDIFIIAIALVHGAKVIYSTDPDFKTIVDVAGLSIVVRNKEDILRYFIGGSYPAP